MTVVHWADWFDSDLPGRDRMFLDLNIQNRLVNPLFCKWYDRFAEQAPQTADHPMSALFRHVDEIRASLAAR